MSRLNKTEQIIELAMMFQNSYCGLCIEDIQNKFECSRRSAERMKALLFDLFPDKIEEVSRSDDKKKYWRFVKGTINALISFTADDFANLEYLKGLSTDENKQKQLDELGKNQGIDTSKEFTQTRHRCFRNIGVRRLCGKTIFQSKSRPESFRTIKVCHVFVQKNTF